MLFTLFKLYFCTLKIKFMFNDYDNPLLFNYFLPKLLLLFYWSVSAYGCIAYTLKFLSLLTGAKQLMHSKKWRDFGSVNSRLSNVFLSHYKEGHFL